MKKALLALLCLGALSGSASADQIAVTKFKGIDSNSNSVVIDPASAQDLLNVDVDPGGSSVKKRPGYGLYKTLATSQALHGGYHFFDSSGNDVTVWGSSTSLYGIVGDATPTQITSSATLNSTWDCADTQGSAYCVDSNRDFYLKTNGATLQSYNTSPLGTMVEATPDRIAVAGVSGNLNTIYHSASNAFTTFTVGPLNTDAFTEPIAAPGSKLTHIRWACGKLLWWKDQSFGYEAFDDQYSLQIKIISDNIGTFDNTSAIDPGGSVWFRGQDGHIWKYDCAGLIKESIEITPLIQASGRRTSNFWTQTSQSDFQAGSSSPTFPTQPLSFTISAGDVVPGSFTATDNSSATWSSGFSNSVSIWASSVTLSLNNSGNVTNNDFESALAGNWYFPSGLPLNNWLRSASSGLTCGTVNPQSGSNLMVSQPVGSFTADFQAIDLSTNVLQTVSIPVGACTTSWTQGTLTPSSSNIGKRVRFRFHFNTTLDGDIYMENSDNYIWGGAISFYYIAAQNGSSYAFLQDNVASGSSTVTTGNLRSRVFNTGLPYSFLFSSATWSVNSATPSFIIQTSTASNGSFFEVATSTNTNTQINKQYVRYVTTITITGQDTDLTAITGVNFIAMSSGTYYSQVKNASSLSAYSTFNPTYSNGDGSHTFYVRSGNSTWGTLSPTAPLWTAQPANALIASTFTATFFQIIDSFTITSATGTAPVLNEFTVNWFDGNATDQAYMLYFKDAIWADVSEGVGVSSNTYIFRYDLINEGWTLYNFGAGGMLVQNNHLLFGDVAATGKIFEFESGHSDNGAAINAYWKSKDFTGSDSFKQSTLSQIDVFAEKNQGFSLTGTYALDTSTTTTSYSISLSSPIATVIQNRKTLPTGKTGYTFNYKLGDSSDSSDWEVFGYRISFDQLPWRPSIP